MKWLLLVVLVAGCLQPSPATQPTGEPNQTPFVAITDEGTNTEWSYVEFQASGPANTWFAFWLPYHETLNAVTENIPFEITVQANTTGKTGLFFAPGIATIQDEPLRTSALPMYTIIQDGDIYLQENDGRAGTSGAGYTGSLGFIMANGNWTLNYRYEVEQATGGQGRIGNYSMGTGGEFYEFIGTPSGPQQHMLDESFAVTECAWVHLQNDWLQSSSDFIGSFEASLPSGTTRAESSVHSTSVVGGAGFGAGGFSWAYDFACSGSLEIQIEHASPFPGIRVTAAKLSVDPPWPPVVFNGQIVAR